MRIAGILVITLVCCVIVRADYDSGRTHFIDKGVSPTGVPNFLFRGDEPKLNDTFAFDAIVQDMRKMCQSEGSCTLPSSVYFIDINFLASEIPKEHKDLEMEENYWKEHSKEDPNKLDETLRKELAKTLGDWEMDKLPSRIPSLRQMLDSDIGNGTSAVIYVHCEAGTDRTGEVSGSYYMQYLKWDFTQALTYDNHIQHRNISSESMHGMQWYCFYLQYKLGFPAMSCQA